jgi:hypothetical protein
MFSCGCAKWSTCILVDIVALHPDLEDLEMEGCRPPTSNGYCLIPSLKKLSELTLSYCQVHYVRVNLLETHVFICESMWENTPRNTFYILKQDLLQY